VATYIEFKEGEQEAMDVVEGGIDSDVFVLDFWGELLNDDSHLNSCSFIDLHFDLLSYFVFVEKLLEL
jgi:hypothetical protein